jgi:enoyl-CoA hydratase/carnithine racemase
MVVAAFTPNEKHVMSATITRSNLDGTIAVLTLDMPNKGANILSSHVLNELEEHLDALKNEEDLKGLIILSGKPGTFIAGADLREFVASLDADRADIVGLCRRGRLLFSRLHELPFVSVAAIDRCRASCGDGTCHPKRAPRKIARCGDPHDPSGE